jgi:hypothetical protein
VWDRRSRHRRPFLLFPLRSKMAHLTSCSPVSVFTHYLLYISLTLISSPPLRIVRSFSAEPTGFNGFNTGFGQSPFGNGVATPPVPPLPPSVVAAGPGPAQKNTNPANVFAAMKAGTFANANDSAPQSAGEAFLRAVDRGRATS